METSLWHPIRILPLEGFVIDDCEVKVVIPAPDDFTYTEWHREVTPTGHWIVNVVKGSPDSPFTKRIRMALEADGNRLFEVRCFCGQEWVVSFPSGFEDIINCPSCDTPSIECRNETR